MNDIRYKPVFGDQTWFDDGPDDAEMVAIYALRLKRWYKLQDGECYLSTDKEQSWKRSRNGYPGLPLLVQRRIIRTPVWTKEDQKAGRLPEVGCRIYVPMMLGEQTVIYSSEKVIVSISDNEGAVTRTEVGSIDRIKPIESPEEKAARLEDEWVEAAIYETVKRKDTTNDEHERLKVRLGDVYRALLSGDLPVPSKDNK